MKANISIQISVYITSDDKLELFRNCLNSIISQISIDDEVIIVNDGSSAIVDEFLAGLKDDRIRTFKQEHSGLPVARNLGMEKASGDWIVFVDADDYVPERGIDNIRNALDDKYDVFIFDYFTDNGKEKKYNSFFDMSKTVTKERINMALLWAPHKVYCSDAFLDVGVAWAKAYKREYLQNNSYTFCKELLRCQDNIFNMHVLNGTDRIKFINKPVYSFRPDHFTSYQPWLRDQFLICIPLLSKMHFKYYCNSDNKTIIKYRNDNLVRGLEYELTHYLLNKEIKKTKHDISDWLNKIYRDETYREIPKLKYLSKKNKIIALMYTLRVLRLLGWKTCL